ncbi:hypothetical protein SynA1825c_02534 [Synechococcus sp. A18-25c]|nr:hypothetical protein SynA1825c_02534 [Synechococcus sp. A18-25c]
MLDDFKFIVPSDQSSNALVKYLEESCYKYHRGSLNDLVSRHLSALDEYEDCVIVRVTSDCPLVDPKLLDLAVKTYFEGSYEYVSTYTPANLSKFCNGSDIEVFSKSTLIKVSNFFDSPKDREHVTFPLWDGRLSGIKRLLLAPASGENYSDVRITLDYQEDLEVLKILLETAKDIHAPLPSFVEIYRNQGLSRLNSQYSFDQGWIQ